MLPNRLQPRIRPDFAALSHFPSAVGVDTTPVSGAVARSVEAHLDDLALTPADFGAVPNDTTPAVTAANVAAFSAAIAACSSLAAYGVSLRIPDADWYVKPSGMNNNIRLKSNVTVWADSWSARIRVAPDCGDYHAVFWDGGVAVSNVVFRGLTLDQNPTGNTTCDIRTQDGVTILDNSRCQFLIYVTGTGSHDIYALNCNLDAVCGVNSFDVNAAGAKRVGFVGNRVVFKRGRTTGTMPAAGPFNGASGYDASVGYFACREVLGEGNHFFIDDYADFNGGVEIHGVEQAWVNNHFHGFYTAFAIVPPFSAGDNQDPANVKVAGNHINRAAVAIGMQLPSSAVGARGWALSDNVITLFQGTGHHDSTEAAGIRLSDNGSGGGVLDGLEIIGTRVEFEPDTRASSTRYSHALAITQHGIALEQHSALRNATLKLNKVIRAPAAGIALGFYASDAELTGVNATGNETIDCGSNPNNVAVNSQNFRCHFSVTGKCSNVRVHDNDLLDTGAPTNLIGLYGMRLGPHVSAGSPLYCFVHNNRDHTTLFPLPPYIFDFGYTLFAQNFGAITNGVSIGHFQCPSVRFQPTGNVTGALLAFGTYHGQRVTLFNESPGE
jgi:hypothetical protein